MAGGDVGVILVQMRFHRPGRQLHDLAPESRLQGFQVQGFGRRGSDQGPDFPLDFLRQRFLEPFFWPVRAREASSLA